MPLTWYCFIETPTGHFTHTGTLTRVSWYLEGLVDIFIFTGDIPWAPFILLRVGTRVWTISRGHRCAGWCPLFSRWDARTFPCRKKESRGSFGGTAPTLGMLWGCPGVDFLLQMDFPLLQSRSVTYLLVTIGNRRRETLSSFLLSRICFFWTYFLCVSASHLFFVGSKRKQELHAYLLNKELLKQLKLIIKMKI